jgi:hypothetical protein
MNEYLLTEYVRQRGKDVAREIERPERRAAAELRRRRGGRRRWSVR